MPAGYNRVGDPTASALLSAAFAVSSDYRLPAQAANNMRKVVRSLSAPTTAAEVCIKSNGSKETGPVIQYKHLSLHK